MGYYSTVENSENCYLVERLNVRLLYKGPFTWYRNDFHSRTSSFHPHIILCICLHDTETKFRSRTSLSGTSSFRFSIRMKFSFLYDISFWYQVNWKRTPFRDENANRVIWGEWCMRLVFKMTDKTVVFKTAEPVDFVMWMQNELHSETKLIPEWISFWYHVNGP